MVLFNLFIRVQNGDQGGDGLPGYRVNPARGKIGQWPQHKGANMHARMRQDHRIIHHHAAKIEDIDIEDAGFIALHPDTAEPGLTFVQNRDQLIRREVGFDFDHRVLEPGLVRSGDRGRAVPW